MSFPKIPRRYYGILRDFSARNHPFKGFIFKKGHRTNDLELLAAGWKPQKLLDSNHIKNITNPTDCQFPVQKLEIPETQDKISPEILRILQDPALIDTINVEFDKKIVREVETRKLIFLVAFGGRLTLNCTPTSTNLLVNDESGAGKDHLCKNVMGILPQKDTIHRTRISPTVFTYWHNGLKEPEWTWDGKTVYLEDVSNAVLNCEVVKVMSSKRGESLSTITVNNRALDVLIRGKPSLILTLANAYPQKETLRRYPIVNLDSTSRQTELIIQRQAEMAKNGTVPEYDRNITEALSHLKPVKIKIPYADLLTKALSYERIIVRTSFNRLLDYIKFSTAIHQFQREIDPAGFLLAQAEDYELARSVLLKMIRNQHSLPVTKQQNRILEVLRDLKEEHPSNWFSVCELSVKITFCSERTIRRELERLLEFGFVSADKAERADSRKLVTVFQYVSGVKFNLPEWKDVENLSSVSNVSIKSNLSNMSIVRTIDRNVTNDMTKRIKERTADIEIEYEDIKDGESKI